MLRILILLLLSSPVLAVPPQAPPIKTTVPTQAPPLRITTPEVVVVRPFPSGIRYNSSHRCDQCGRSQYYVSGRGPTAGTHTHTCSNCSTTWYH